MKYLIFVLLMFFILSCQEKSKECNSCDEELSLRNKIKPVSNDELEMYVPSELATLMLQMYDVNENWKEEILKGNVPKEFPEEYKKLHSATSVNESAGSDFYNAMASSYLITVDDIINAIPENAKEKFNNMVNVCINCHMQVCPGPISRIKKLIIKE